MLFTKLYANILRWVERFIEKLNQSSKLYGCIFAIYFLFVTFPAHYHAISNDYDMAWKYGINDLSSQQAWPGITYTYGPLGYFIWPLNIDQNLIYAILLRLIIHIVWIFGIFYFIFQGRKIFQVILFVCAYLLATAIGLVFEYHLLLTFVFMLSITKTNIKLSYLIGSICGTSAALFLFMKFNIGVAAAGMLVIYNVVGLTKEIIFKLNEQNKTTITPYISFTLAAVIAYTIITYFLIFRYFGSFGEFADWLHTSLEISRNYSVSHSVVGSQIILSFGLMTLLSFMVLVIALLMKGYSQLSHMNFVAIVLIFFAFKAGFVRQDGHEIMFFPTILGLVGVWFLVATNTREIKWLTLSFVFISTLALPVAYAHRWLDLTSIRHLVSGRKGVAHIGHLFNLDELRKQLDFQSGKYLESNELKIPAKWVKRIQEHGGGVDFIPYNLLYGPANRLKWKPNPILQYHVGNSKFLDRKMANFYRGPDGPVFLIAEFDEIDRRHLLHGMPQTWRTLIRQYELIHASLQKNLLFFQRKPRERLHEALHPLDPIDIYPNQWVPVPASNSMLFAGLDMRLTFAGQVRKLFFRVDPVYVEVMKSNGETNTYRITPETAAHGLFLNYLPSRLATFASLLNGNLFEAVVKFRLSGPGITSYRTPLTLTWRQLAEPAVTPKAKVYGQVVPRSISQIKLENEVELNQTFLCPCQELGRFDVRFTSQANSPPVKVRLTAVTGDRPIFEDLFAAPAPMKQAWQSFALGPVPYAAGKTYRISLKSEPNQSGDPIAVGKSQGDNYPYGAASVNGLAMDSDIAFRYACAELKPGSTWLDLGPGVPPPMAWSTFHSEGQSRRVIFVHPPSALCWPLLLPTQSTITLKTALALDPGMKGLEPKSDGVTFKISVETAEGAVVLRLTRHRNLHREDDNQALFPVNLDLSEYAGQSITLYLETTAGPAEDHRHDWAGWVEPVIVVNAKNK